MDPLKQIKKIKVIPVVKINDAENAIPLAEALISGGLPCAEITLRTEEAIKTIKKLAREKEFLVGAGTVLTVDDADAVCQAGSQFVVSPGFNPKVVEWCQKNKVPVFPGVATPTDILMAMEYGLEVLKFFPAEDLGGISTIKAISAPFFRISFIPTGGINLGNLSQYLSHPKIVACGGTWMVLQNWITERQFKKIEEETQKTVTQIQESMSVI